MLMHVHSAHSGEEPLAPFVRTVGAVFPGVFLFGQNNVILVASKSPVELDALIRALQRGAAAFPAVQPVVSRALEDFRIPTFHHSPSPFTDDRNDVEIRTFRLSHKP